MSPSEFSDTLRSNALEFYGSAGDLFLSHFSEAVSRDEEGEKALFQRRMAHFLKTSGANLWNGPMARIAQRFAFYYAAGCRAAEFGCLPWKRADMRRAAQACLDRAILPATVLQPHTPKQSIAVVRSYIEQNRGRFLDLKRSSARMTREKLDCCPGIIYSTGNGRREFVFASATFKETVCAGLPADLVFQHLQAAGLVNSQRGGKQTVTRDFPDPLTRARVISVREKILSA